MSFRCSKKNPEIFFAQLQGNISLAMCVLVLANHLLAWLHFIIDTRVVLSAPYANQTNNS